MKISRKKFIKQTSIVSLGFIAFTKLAAKEWIEGRESLKLVEDVNGVFHKEGEPTTFTKLWNTTMNDIENMKNEYESFMSR